MILYFKVLSGMLIKLKALVIYGYMSLLTALCCCQEGVIRALGWATSPQLYENVLLCRAI